MNLIKLVKQYFCEHSFQRVSVLDDHYYCSVMDECYDRRSTVHKCECTKCGKTTTEIEKWTN